MRPWAALALGVLSRGEASDDLARSLVRALDKEGNRDLVRANAVALGLAGNALAVDTLAELLHDGSADTRVAAAEGLTLIGTPEAMALVREQLSKDPCPSTRAAIAPLVGRAALPGGADFLTSVYDKAESMEERAAASLALGWQGDTRALARLEAVADAKRGSGADRSAALRAAGLLLAPRSPLALRRAGLDGPVASLPGWMRATWGTTL